MKECNYDESSVDITDSVAMYFSEIRKIPLLTVEEEQKLAGRIAQGDLQAKQIFIKSNLRLVTSVVHKYTGYGLSLLDLIQEGNLGLMKAVDKYDVNTGFRFSTYAIIRIDQAIRRAIDNKGRNIRIPVAHGEKIQKYKKAVVNLEFQLGREPTFDEVAEAMKLPVSKVKELYKSQKDTVSLNTLMDDEEKGSEIGLLVPSSEGTPEDIVMDEMMAPQVRKVFTECNLKKREIEVLMLKYGFDGEEPMTFPEIAKIYNITMERVRQIEATALKKIRRSRYVKTLVDYRDDPEKALSMIEEFREKYSKSKSLYKAYLHDDARTK